ncbi:phosphoenolpyruvate-protein phosphotransferase [Nitrosococcus halophilus Nc 4]|uniref:phosphoenolpyruvate--protein phosphotransferase n=1 Tax=Nitrosococcus halophilus (strain Nc4) TaxID=472759 RepID=D5BZ24_NITHN|nr:phosphoenolpyruvate--protein phosphotransferase [Nitrosococcus halophilus]ADE14237.1 phosphoenolpyruvate-protein phosphotransferase [Nitrosococcus halophilus Nc 4]
MNPDLGKDTTGTATGLSGLTTGSPSSRTLDSLSHIVREVSLAASLEEVLQVIVVQTRKVMAVDVCSVYLTESDGSHVLMATQGLHPEAVGLVRLISREGLVGLVAERAEPVNLENAAAHPRFKFIPGSGEEPFRAFLGVPVLHQRELLGVLVVQQQAARQFTEADVSFLFTLAAQLGGVIAHARASGVLQKPKGGRNGDASERYLTGIAGAPGVALGKGVVIYSAADLDTVPERQAVDAGEEERVFRLAVAHVSREMQSLGNHLERSLANEYRALFKAYAMLAGSHSLVEATVERIRAGEWAPSALSAVIKEQAKRLETMEDPYLRERANDLREIGRRILAYLQNAAPVNLEYPEDTILVGENLTAMDLAEVPIKRLVGVLSAHGSGFSHVAILAHAMGIPAIMGISTGNLGQLDQRELILDGYQGRVYLEPSAPVRREFARLAREERQFTEDLKCLRELPAKTPDGFQVHLYANIGLLADTEPSLAAGAEGVGLYRTELPFMVRDRFPTEEEQYAMYRQLLQAFAPSPVVLRVLDVGGDKFLPYFSIREANPFLGWRGIRVVLDHPEIFLTQVRAALRAAEGLNNLSLLLPMISSVSEVEEATRLVRQAYEELENEGIEVAWPCMGAMIEVPAAVYQVEALARRVDFLSVGTNDLAQYLMAVDRSNERVAGLYNSLHPAVLAAILKIVEAGRRQHKPVSVCGEMAGEPTATILLLGMGVDNLSVTAGDLPRVKWVIRNFSQQHAKELLNRALQEEKPEPIYQMLCQALDAAGLGGLIRVGK